jgi:hypothetical protein
MRILTLLLVALTVGLIISTMELHNVLEVKEWIMLCIACCASTIGCIATTLVSINSEE